jgi:hypothetical protein
MPGAAQEWTFLLLSLLPECTASVSHFCQGAACSDHTAHTKASFKNKKNGKSFTFKLVLMHQDLTHTQTTFVVPVYSAHTF